MLQSVCWSGYVRLRVNNPQHTFRRRRSRFIAPVRIEMYKCTHVSQWVYVGK